MGRIAWLGLIVASAAAAQPARNDESTSAIGATADEAILREHRLPTQGAHLLQILRDRTPNADTIATFQSLVARLKAARYGDRLAATRELTRLGVAGRPLIENLLLDFKADAETMARLRQAREQMADETDAPALPACVRQIARQKPAGSLRVLIDFVPFATDETLRQEVQCAINALAQDNGKPAPAIVAALKDEAPARRAAAGEAMLRSAAFKARDQITPLLGDPHPLVRYQIGMALVENEDKAGLPLLIKAIAELSPERVEYVIELLERVAGDDAPSVYYRGRPTAGDVATAWRKWHDVHHAKLDLSKQLARPVLGKTIIAQTVLKANAKNKIFEIGPGPDHPVLWEFDSSRNCLDLQILGPNRILVAEYFDRRVTERDLKGNILKQFPAALPVGCQRLRNGDTLIVTRPRLSIVDADGRETFAYPSPAGEGSILAAQCLRNGQLAVATSGGRCRLIDAQGRELKSFQMGAVYTMGGNFEVLSNGRILAPLQSANTIVEFDWDGNRHWQATVQRPTSVTRLKTGNTLVTCSLDYRVVEIDRDGKEVWRFETDGRPHRARRR